MPKNTSKFTPSGRDPLNGFKSGIYESFTPVEVLNAFASGTGPGVADDNGTPTPGTIECGHIVSMAASGGMELATSPDLSAAFSKMLWVVFSGDDDFSGSFVGAINCFHGGARFDTEKFNTAQTYTPGAPLVASAGLLTPKAAYNDHIQVLGYVGPRGVLSGVLDVLMPQSAGAGY